MLIFGTSAIWSLRNGKVALGAEKWSQLFRIYLFTSYNTVPVCSLRKGDLLWHLKKPKLATPALE